MVKPIKEHEVKDWVNQTIHVLAGQILFKEQTPEFWEGVRKQITNEYYRSRPTGLVMLQSIITDEINLYNQGV